MSLFDIFKKKENVEKAEEIQRSDPSGYYFQNTAEFLVYSHLFAKGREILWLSGDNYAKEYAKGYDLFEQRKYKQAIEVYKNALVLNPIGISARFEICEAYMKLSNWDAARKTLLEMKDYLVENQSIAKFYRRLGFIATEQRDYQVASACFLYSTEFEMHPSVVEELAYIKSLGGIIVSRDDIKKTLQRANIPVIDIPPVENK